MLRVAYWRFPVDEAVRYELLRGYVNGNVSGNVIVIVTIPNFIEINGSVFEMHIHVAMSMELHRYANKDDSMTTLVRYMSNRQYLRWECMSWRSPVTLAAGKHDGHFDGVVIDLPSTSCT